MEVDQSIVDLEIENLSENCRFSNMIEHIPAQVKRVIENGWWRERRPRKMAGKLFTYSTFQAFCEDHPPQGLGIKVDLLRKLCEHDPEALVAIREASTRAVGKPIANSNNITINDSEPAVRGTHKDYTLYRLKEQAPELYQRVLEGEMSANKAAIKAGFRKPMVSVEFTPDGFAAFIKRKFSDDEIERIVKQLW